MTVKVIGAGLAGCEAAWQLSKRGINVRLYDMKPKKFSPAHNLDTFCELVCSNSLRSDRLENAVGLLKEEMRSLGSLIMQCADETRVPAGGALAVDRNGFSSLVTARLKEQANIEIVCDEVESIEPDEYTIVASGPLTSDKLYDNIRSFLGGEYLHFFDAAAPIVTLESLDMSKAYPVASLLRQSDVTTSTPYDRGRIQRFLREFNKCGNRRTPRCGQQDGFRGLYASGNYGKAWQRHAAFRPFKTRRTRKPPKTANCPMLLSSSDRITVTARFLILWDFRLTLNSASKKGCSPLFRDSKMRNLCATALCTATRL